MKYILSLITGWLFLAQVSFAGNYAYLYIEGDKQTPFYVKLEGQMMPRLGKNYCIIPNLASGVSYIEVLFQQNAYPAQKFAINIPDGGNRGFVLQKVNDRQFALYDIQQGNYIVSGNKPEEDHVPEPQPQVASPLSTNEGNTTAAAATNNATTEEGLPAFKPVKKSKTKKVAAEEKPAEETKKEDNRFISDIELNNGGGTVPVADPLPEFNTPKPVPVKGKKKAKKQATEDKETSLAAINDEEEGKDSKVAATPENKEEPATTDAGIPNSDCKNAMSSEDFESFALKILDKNDDDARLKVLSKSKGHHCFTTEQIRIIANNLDTQSGRYEVVKMLYAQTSDQGNYTQLEGLFKTNYLKEKFRQIISPK